MVVHSIDNVKSVLTQRELDLFCATYNIPANLRLELPGRDDTIKDSLKGKIGIFTRFIEFVNFHISLSKFLLCVLQYYQIDFSQLSARAAAKYNDVSVKKDPLLFYDLVDFKLLDKLDNNRTLIRKYSETFMCLVGLRCSFTDTDARPTLLRPNKSDMGLLDFIKSSDLSKINTGERTLAFGEVPLLTKTAYMVVNTSAQSLRLVTHTITDEIREHFGKNKRTVGASAVPPPVKKARTGGANVDSGAAASRLEEFMSFSITLTPERDCEDESVSNHGDNVRTFPPSGRYVVLSSSYAKTDILASHVVPPIPSVQANADIVVVELVNEAHGSPVDDFYDSQTINSASAHNIYVPNWDVTNDARMDDPHEITIREKFEKKFTDSLEVIQLRDAEIVKLRSKLEKAEGEAADVVELRRRVSKLEATSAVKVEELDGLSFQNAELSGQVSGLGSVRDSLNEKVVELESECERLRSQVEDARLSELSYQNALGKVVSLAVDQGIQQGLEARVDHGKASRDLSMVEAYDPGVKVRYEEAIGELENISLPFLHRLDSYKDAPLDRVMASLYLEGFLFAEDETSHFHKLQPILEQVVVPIYYERGGSRVPGTVCREVLLGEALEASLARARKHKQAVPSNVSMLGTVTNSRSRNLSSVDNQQVPSHDDMFDTALLDKPVDS
ncbi:hypothetical protein Tco_1509329 [Tanacetum coccineum]